MNDEYKKLIKLLNNSYSPYSKFATAAIVNTDAGKFYGVNVENASYGATICAERNAIFNAITNGAKDFKSISIISNSKRKDIVPCALCLQVMAEFFDKNTIVNVYNIDGELMTYKFSNLLPHYFNNEQLENK